MGNNDAFFSRIREALKEPRHAHPHGPETHSPSQPTSDQFREWLPNPGTHQESWLQSFRQQAEILRIELIELPNPSHLTPTLTHFARTLGWKKIASHADMLSTVTPLDLPLVRADEAHTTADLESCDASITNCEALIAQTGSVLVSSRQHGSRALSVLPPHHIVVATLEQLLPDLSAAFTLVRTKYNGQFPSMLGFITGPSRTGDIERILVLGAHGPKKLTILLLP